MLALFLRAFVAPPFVVAALRDSSDLLQDLLHLALVKRAKRRGADVYDRSALSPSSATLPESLLILWSALLGTS